MSQYGKKSKIYGISLKELIYTVVFVLLGIVLVISLIFMFCNRNSDEKKEKSSSGQYEAGVYTSCVTLNGNPMEVTVTLDSNHINSITVDNISDAITTMYPLVEPAFEDISKQIVDTQSVDNIKFSEESQYTYSLLYNAIVDTINKGKK